MGSETSAKIVRQGKVSVIEIGSGENSASKQSDEIDFSSDVTGEPKESETPKPSEQSEQPKILDQAQSLEKSEQSIDKSQKSEATPEPDDLNASTASKESKNLCQKLSLPSKRFLKKSQEDILRRKKRRNLLLKKVPMPSHK